MRAWILGFCMRGLCVAVCCLIGSTAGAAPADLEQLSERLVNVGLRVELAMDSIRHDSERGLADYGRWRDEIDQVSDVLEGIEVRLNTLPELEAEPLLRKLESIRFKLENLRRAVDRPETFPPESLRGGGPAVRKDRRSVQERGVPANDDCANAFDIGYGSFSGSTADATNDGEASCGSSINSPDVWFNFVATESGTVVFDTIGSGFDTVLSVHSGCPGNTSNQRVCNDDRIGLHSSVALGVSVGYLYRVRISGFNGATGDYVLNVGTGGEITGLVTERVSGTPVENARVEVFDSEGYSVGYCYSVTNGTYQLSGLETGEYLVATDLYYGSWVDELYNDVPCPGGLPYGCDPADGDPVGVEAGAITAGIDFALDQGGRISGLVRETGSSSVIEGAAVRAYDADGVSRTYDYTDESGLFLLEGLQTGNHFLVVESSNWADELYNDMPCPGGPPNGCDPTQGTPVPVQLNNTTPNINFHLDSLGGIVGVVTESATGDPLAYADLRLYNQSGSYIRWADADSDGVYRFGGLDDGTYFVVASAYGNYVTRLFDGIDCPNGSCDVTSGTPVVVVDQNTVSGIDFQLEHTGSVSGFVQDTTTYLGAPGVTIRAYNEDGQSVEATSTDSSGIYTLEGLETGTYFIATNDYEFMDVLYEGLSCHPDCDPTTGTPVSVANGTTTTGISFDVTPLGRIIGLVSESASGDTVYARVELYENDGSYHGYDYTSSGMYMFAGLDDGDYFVVAENRSTATYLAQLYDGIPCWGGAPSGCDVTTGDPVSAAAATVTSGIDFQLKKRGSISGTVVDAVTGEDLSGYVYVENADGEIVGSDSFYGGNYEVYRLMPGELRVIADCTSHQDEVWDDVSCAGEYPDSCDSSTGDLLTIHPGDEINGVDFALAPLGSIAGTVRAAGTGEPLSSFYVRVYDADGAYVKYDVTDGLGQYEVTGLWAGDYFISTDQGSWTHFDQLYQGIPCPGGPGDGCDPTSGTVLQVSLGGALSGIDFDLEETAAISGFVGDADTGAPLSNYPVKVYNADDEYVRGDNTDNEGIYHVQGLVPNTYFVATDRGYYNPDYLDELYNDIPCLGGPPYGCDPHKGTPVLLESSQTVRFVDFALELHSSGIHGAIADVKTGEPLGGVRVDVWDASTGDFEGSVTSSPAGTFAFNLNAGTYVAATDNNRGFVNQVFDGIECPPEGSAFQGDCDPLLGNMILVQEDETTSGVDFDLRLHSVIFSDGFENGDAGAWSEMVP